MSGKNSFALVDDPPAMIGTRVAERVADKWRRSRGSANNLATLTS